MIDAAGYVYVLSTSLLTSSGQPIVKIGMTTRTPDKRAAELSRSGPVGMNLEGFVTSRAPRELERWAHQTFVAAKYNAGGGSEYFAIEPGAVLNWLRQNSPLFELDSARAAAWGEYCSSSPFKARARLMWIPVVWTAMCFLADLKFWNPNSEDVFYSVPFGLVTGCLISWLGFLPYRKRLQRDLDRFTAHLEKKYHLPPGGVRA